MPSNFNQRGFGTPTPVTGSMGGLGGGLGGILQNNGLTSSLASVRPNVQTKSDMPGINSAFMKQAKNPQRGTPSGARSFMNSGAGLNGMMNTLNSQLGKKKLGGM